MADYKWKPIEDLPEDWTKLASSEQAGLASVWREHYETIKDSKALKQFNERLHREWAIETGIIENLYYIDRGVTLTLIEKGIEASLIPHGTTDKPAELIVPILKDQEEVVTGLFDFVGQQRQLSTSYIKQLHQALTQHQRTTAAKDSFGQMIEVELLRGDWKKLPNNPTKSDGSIHEFCPPEQVGSEMDQLIAWHQEHLENQVPPEVEAAWLHHRFTQIHPFQDGNGRMARTLASLIFLRAGLFPLVVHRDERDGYIDALEKADQGQMESLVQFFSRAQKRAIKQVVSLSENILLENAPLEQVIAATVEKIQRRKEREIGEIKLIKQLEEVAFDRLSQVRIDLAYNIERLDNSYRFLVERNNIDNKLHFRIQTESVAEMLGYHANTAAYSSWACLELIVGDRTEIVFSFHALGKDITDLMASTAFIRIQNEAAPISKESFQFAKSELEQSVIARFESWLNDTILAGIDLWRRQL